MATKPSTLTERALKKIQDQLTCGICLDLYKEPKMLQCFHVFCKQCLQPLAVAKGGVMGQSLCCPNCRRQTDIPTGGLSALQGAFFTNNLMEIQKMLKTLTNGMCNKCKKREAVCCCTTCGVVCQRCKETHYEWEDLSAHEIIDIDSFTNNPATVLQRKKSHCSKHQKQESDLYCETCEELICRDCIVRLHHNHNYDLVSAVFPKHDKQLANSLRIVEEQIMRFERAMQSVNCECDLVDKCETGAMTEIKSVFAAIRMTIEAREKALIEEAKAMAQEKRETLTSQRSKYQMQVEELRICWEFIEGSRKTCSQEDLLRMKQCILDQVHSLIANINPGPLAVNERANLQFCHSLSFLVKDCQQFGKVYSHSVHPEKCLISEDVPTLCMRGETAILPVKVFDRNGEAYMGHLDSLMCKLTNEIKLRVTKGEDNVYNVSYTPRHNGKQQLHITVEDNPILNSPVTITVLPNLRAPAKIIDGLDKPWGVAVTTGNRIVVAERGKHCLSYITRNGDKKSIGTQGSGPGQFYWPAGIAIQGENVLITDYWNHRIQKWSLGGQYLKTVGSKCTGPLQLHQPTSIAVHPHNQMVYIADKGNSRIQVLNADLSFAFSFGRKGSNDGEFQELCDVTVDTNSQVYAADCGNNRVQIFRADGVYLRQIGSEGEGEGQLRQPVSIAVDDANGIVYIGEYGNNRISVFSTGGVFIRMFGQKGNNPTEFSGPFGLATDSFGALYVSDTRNNRIQVFT